ncbi:MAG: InlB B-repeat-containing protein [Eubacteriales bacterium]|nr:InlB B-repeat-containing protein [Eubacteriales bacterium]
MKSKSKVLFASLCCLLFGFVLIFGAMLGGNSMTVYAAEEDHSHCICGGGIASGEHTSCSDVTFLPYSGGNFTYDDTGAAYLYLESDVVHSSNSNNHIGNNGILVIKNGQTLYLCLNGHSFQNGDRTNNVIDVESGGKLILCDCKGTGWIGGRTSGANSGAVWVEGSFTMYGGNLKNSSGLKNGGGLYLVGSGSATMYGGTISDNFAFADGGGVFLKNSSSFTMYGGSISGNRATDEGGGVYVNMGTTFTMYGGVIENNENGTNGGGVFVSGTFTMNGGSIKGNTTAGRGGGICVESYGNITINGGVIEDNYAYGNGGGISTCWASTFTMNGGVVQNNESKFNGGGIFLFGNGGWNNADSTFIITNGTVTKNKAGGVGGGIYFYENTKFTMNATATTAKIIIMDNEGSNLYLTDNKNYVITLTALTEGSRIGVTAMRNPWMISTANDTDYSHLFSADSDDYHIGYHPVDKKLALTPDFTKFTVRYDLNGGEGTVADSICKTFTSEGRVQVTSVSPTRKCHTFLGWAETADATSATYVAGDTIYLTGDMTLYAVWGISHDLTKVDKVEPDCTNDGKEEYWSCACGKYFEDASATVEITDISTWGILPVQHTFTEWIAEVSSTCASEGVKAHKDCGICHKHFDADGNAIADLTISVDSTAHRFGEWIEELPATEDTEGVKGHKDCEICHKHFDVDGNEITNLTITKLTSGGDETGDETEEKTEEKTGDETGDKTEEKTGDKTENGGLSGGAIAGITVGSVAVAEIGGFSIFWFAIKKKKFSDFIAVIKVIFKNK